MSETLDVPQTQDMLQAADIPETPDMSNQWVSAILALSGGVDHGVPWHRVAYLGQRGMEDRIELKCDL